MIEKKENVFNYKGVTSDLLFGSKTSSLLENVIDKIYAYFNINDIFPEFKIIIHPDYQKNPKVAPETRSGLIMLSTDKCDCGQYDYYQQITWQFSHELVHACKGYKEGRKEWEWLPDFDEEEILAGGIAICIIKNLCPSYDYTKEYSKANLKQCEEKAESLVKIIF
jgi:hypothetical protein